MQPRSPDNELAESSTEASGSVHQLLAKLQTGGVDHVLWKNLYRTDSALAGDGDIDILFRASDRPAVLHELSEQGWASARNPRVLADDRIRHFFRPLTAGGIIGHLHIYFGVVTGESWLKEYDLPLEEFIFADTTLGDDGLRRVGQDASLYLFLLRHLLKGSSEQSRLLYRKQSAKYTAERDRHLVNGDLPQIDTDPLGIADLLAPLNLTGELEPPSRTAARTTQKRLAKYRRFGRGAAAIKRIQGLGLRVLLWRSPTRYVQPRGAIVAIVGTDGSGKSSMVDVLSERIGHAFAIRRFHLGRPVPVSIATIKKFGGSNSSTDEQTNDTETANDMSASPAHADTRSARGAAGIARALVLGLARAFAAWRAKRLANRGYVVLADRWPNSVPQGIDGGRMISADEQGVRRVAALFEERLYETMPEADICVRLEVSEDLAVARNQARTKGVKESDESIRDRHARTARIRPKAERVVTFDNSGTLEESAPLLFAEVWNSLFGGDDGQD